MQYLFEGRPVRVEVIVAGAEGVARLSRRRDTGTVIVETAAVELVTGDEFPVRDAETVYADRSILDAFDAAEAWIGRTMTRAELLAVA